MPRLVHVLTVAESLVFLRGQITFMRDRGWNIRVVTSPDERLDAFGREHGIEVFGVPMARAITPGSDLGGLARLTAYLRRFDPDVVHAHTPKGGLLGTLAAAAAGVRTRIYHMRGLPLMTATGARRRLLATTEKVACTAATHVLCVSHSLRRVAIDLGLCAPHKIEVLLQGSGNGVDAAGRFNPASVQPETRPQVRRRHAIGPDEVVFGFVGRLVADKGIRELAAAWPGVRRALPHSRLLLLGVWEAMDPVPVTVRNQLEADPSVVFAGFQADTAAHYAAMDVLVLPTYREGFPNVPLEAASMTLPVIATRIPGCEDAVEDGRTGVLVPPRDAVALEQAMIQVGRDGALRDRLGKAGRERVVQSFQRERIWEALAETYGRLTATARRSKDEPLR